MIKLLAVILIGCEKAFQGEFSPLSLAQDRSHSWSTFSSHHYRLFNSNYCMEF